MLIGQGIPYPLHLEFHTTNPKILNPSQNENIGILVEYYQGFSRLQSKSNGELRYEQLQIPSGKLKKKLIYMMVGLIIISILIMHMMPNFMTWIFHCPSP